MSDERRSTTNSSSASSGESSGSVSTSTWNTSSDLASLDEAATLRVPATEFDELYHEWAASRRNVKPGFVPVLYSVEDPPRKFRRLCALAHEQDLRKQLARTGLAVKQIDQYARLATYYPGSRYQPLDRALTYSYTPPRISSSSSDGARSPNYLFRDLPSELGKTTDLEQSLLTPERSLSVDPPTTPDGQPTAGVFNTPVRPSLDVDQLSPVFDSMSVRRSSKEKALKSAVSSSSKANSDGASSRNLVSFVKAGLMDKSIESDRVIGAFRLRMTKKSTSHCSGLSASCASLREQPEVSSPESFSVSRYSGETTLSAREPSYESFNSVVVLVSESMARKRRGLLARFEQTFDVEVVKGKFDERVSHVIVDEDNYEIKVQYILAIGFQKYLVHLAWIKDSVSKGWMLDPEDFEAVLTSRSPIPPSRMARSSTMANRLFSGYAFLCAKPFVKISYDQLVELLAFHAGVVINEPKDFANCDNKIRVCIIGEFRFFNDETNKQIVRHKLRRYNCIKVHYQWIFDVLAAFSLEPLTGHLYDTSLDEARIAGVPEELLK